jgi:hypothetical protein
MKKLWKFIMLMGLTLPFLTECGTGGLEDPPSTESGTGALEAPPSTESETGALEDSPSLIGLNVRINCKSCGTSQFINLGICNNVDLVAYTFEDAFKCPSCESKAIKPMAFVVKSSKNKKLIYSFHGHYWIKGSPRKIAAKDAKTGECPKNQSCNLETDLGLGKDLTWGKLFFTCKEEE